MSDVKIYSHQRTDPLCEQHRPRHWWQREHTCYRCIQDEGMRTLATMGGYTGSLTLDDDMIKRLRDDHLL